MLPARTSRRLRPMIRFPVPTGERSIPKASGSPRPPAPSIQQQGGLDHCTIPAIHIASCLSSGMQQERQQRLPHRRHGKRRRFSRYCSDENPAQSSLCFSGNGSVCNPKMCSHLAAYFCKAVMVYHSPGRITSARHAVFSDPSAR